jgi:hypothetical protein
VDGDAQAAPVDWGPNAPRDRDLSAKNNRKIAIIAVYNGIL